MPDPMLTELHTKANATCLAEVDRLTAENATLRNLLTAYHGQTELFMQHVNSITWLGKLHELQALTEEEMPGLRISTNSI